MTSSRLMSVHAGHAHSASALSTETALGGKANLAPSAAGDIGDISSLRMLRRRGGSGSG